jgi:hypothetical protein
VERILTTKEVTVQTVQVTIQALKVGPKQVTMGLFRQLPYGELVDPQTVQLRGVPWGHVHYWWDGDGRQGWPRTAEETKLHVVWQLGEELRRAVVYKTPDPGQMEGFRAQIQEGLNRWFLASLPTATQFAYKDRDQPYRDHREITLDGQAFRVAFDTRTWLTIDNYWHHRDLDPQQEVEKTWAGYDAAYMPAYMTNRVAFLTQQQENARAHYRQVLHEQHILDILPHVLTQKIRTAKQARDAYADAWAKQWQVLESLPQLFIAV